MTTSTNEEKFDKSLIKSSAKKEDFSNLSDNEIIEKYEKLLLAREKDIKEISYQMGVVNEKYFNEQEKLNKLCEENEQLRNKINKINKLIDNEIKDKQVMNNKISELTKQNIELRKQRNNLSGKSDPLLSLAEKEKQNIENKLKDEKNFKGLASDSIKYQPLFEK